MAYNIDGCQDICSLSDDRIYQVPYMNVSKS